MPPRESLLGIITDLGVASVPVVVGPFVLFARITNLHGSERIEIAIHGPDNNRKIGTPVQLHDPKDPMGMVTINAVIPQFSVNQAGRHYAAIIHKGVELATAPFYVRLPEAALPPRRPA